MKSQLVDHQDMMKNHGHNEQSVNTAEEMAHHLMRNMGVNDEGIYEEENPEQYVNIAPEEGYSGQDPDQDQRMMNYQQNYPQYYSPHQGNYGNIYEMQNDVQRNIINQNESLNGMLRNYIADLTRKSKIAKRK